MLYNDDINQIITKYLDIYDILLLRQSIKKNFEINNNYIRAIKLYKDFKINVNDNYKIELVIYNTIKYINKDTIDILKKNLNNKKIYSINIYEHNKEILFNNNLLYIKNIIDILIQNFSYIKIITMDIKYLIVLFNYLDVFEKIYLIVNLDIKYFKTLNTLRYLNKLIKNNKIIYINNIKLKSLGNINI